MFNETMSGLSDVEKRAAAFYMLAQLGKYEGTEQLLSGLDQSTVVAAAGVGGNALTNSVEKCKKFK